MSLLNSAPLASLGVIVFLGGCLEDATSGTSGIEVLEDSIDNTVLPDVSTFAASSVAMQTEVTAFCASPDADGLTGVQDAWKTLALDWHSVAPYNLGPLDNDLILPRILFIESMRQRGTDYTDTVREELQRALAGENPLDTTFFESLTFTKVGLLALEVLVFEDSRDGHSSDPADILGDYEVAPRKCAYLAGVMAQLVTTAQAVDEGWRVDDGTGLPFRDQMLQPTLPDGTEPIVELTVSLFEHLDYTKTRKLEGILDAQLSGQFYPHVATMLRSLDGFLDQNAETAGLIDLMEERGFLAEAAEVRDNLQSAHDAAAAESRDDLAVAIGRLEGNLKREIPDSLGIFLGINFSDGD